ncbi:lipopolysaccharide biosynthesis protein [Microbacterium trichothecenolyticum]|uniref:lipopolysaccharide biosynthesis protein n=1 Tax=Microbacterium trichothecenolyticum TaxID=69370 RepID=UPI0035BE22D0
MPPRSARSRVKVLLTRFLGFGAVPLISAVVPFLVLPVASRVDGPEGWAAIGTGQAIGSFVAMVASYGWNVNGGARVSEAPSSKHRHAVYAQSLWCRLIVFVVAGTAGAILAAVLVDGTFAPVAALAALATGATGLTVTWFSVGVGSARLALWYEAVPFASLTLLSIGIMLTTGSVIAYPIAMLCGVFIGLVLLNFHLYRSAIPPFVGTDVRAAFRGNLALAVADGIGGSYTTAPVPVAQGILGTQAAAELTSADKIYRIGLTAVVVLGNSLQKWVLEAPFSEGRMRRHGIALALHALVGAGGFLVLTFLGVPLTEFLLGAAVTPPPEVFPAYGAAYFLISLSTPLIRNILVPAGRDRVVLGAILASAAIGLPAMIVGGTQSGMIGIVLGLALSEVVVFVVVSCFAVGVLRSEARSLR